MTLVCFHVTWDHYPSVLWSAIFSVLQNLDECKQILWCYISPNSPWYFHSGTTINTNEPVSLADIHAHAITMSPPCLTDCVQCTYKWTNWTKCCSATNNLTWGTMMKLNVIYPVLDKDATSRATDNYCIYTTQKSTLNQMNIINMIWESWAQPEKGDMGPSLSGPLRQQTGTGSPSYLRLRLSLRQKTQVWEEFGEAMVKDFQSAPNKFCQMVRQLRESRTPSTQSSAWEGSCWPQRSL